MNQIVKHGDLKERLDHIDQDASARAADGFFKSRLAIYLGEWDKGKEVSRFRGVKGETSFRQLEIETGRKQESLKHWHDLYEKYPGREKFVSEYAEPRAKEWAAKALLGPTWRPVLLSTEDEWWTPSKYMEAARTVMGGIDLDPASCAEGNKTVKATEYYDKEMNGIDKIWEGRIFLNPPYGSAGPEFIEKFIHDYGSTFNEGIILVNSRATDADWFQPMFNGVICFTDHRIDFDSPGQKLTSSTHGSCFIYFGPHEKEFAEAFSKFGNIVKRWPNE